MSFSWDLFLLIIGLGLLWGGAEMLVNYASRLARGMGISPIILGLTVVSVGTSIPELMVSSVAAYQGNTGIAIGNIIGSNIANLGLILGVAAVMTPLAIQSSWVKREVPYMIAVTVVFAACGYSGDRLTWPEGLLLLGLMFLFLGYLGRSTVREMSDFRKLANGNGAIQPSALRKWAYFLLSLVGIVILLAGSKVTVDSGIRLASQLGVSESTIGLTLIALGTSLPELATTVVSVMRRSVDLAVGNVIGSNIFNITLIGGVASLIHTVPLAGQGRILEVEFPLLIALSLLIWPLMFARLNFQKWQGLVLIAAYCLFIFLTIST